MKKIFAIAAMMMMVTIYGCTQTTAKNEGEKILGPAISFDELEHDYGTIEQNGNGVYNFVFENSGTQPLVLTNVRSTCGCTVPQYPKEPVKPGKTATIEVKYDTRRIGPFSKSVIVYSNATDTPVVLRIKGKVVPKGSTADNG